MKIEPGCQIRLYPSCPSSNTSGLDIVSPQGEIMEWKKEDKKGIIDFLKINKEDWVDNFSAEKFAQFVAELLANATGLQVRRINWIKTPITYEFYAKE